MNKSSRKSVSVMLTESLAAENITLGLPKVGEEGNMINTAKEAQASQDILEEHLRDSSDLW